MSDLVRELVTDYVRAGITYALSEMARWCVDHPEAAPHLDPLMASLSADVDRVRVRESTDTTGENT